MIEKQVGPMLYHLKLSPILQKLYPVFLVVKLSTTPNNFIPRRHFDPSPIIINGEEEWEVEKILNSHWHYKRYQLLKLVYRGLSSRLQAISDDLELV